ncbi:MAG: hypothetical protein M1490_00455 [Candidatus Bathyarchaeota archaeon]|nr:hypothetical protein [Candidatus Bathyarchaeota archaeon]
MYGPHYSDKPPKVSGDKWEAETLKILKKIFPHEEIRSQVKFDYMPRAIVDFYIPKAKVVVECKACGLTPVPRNCDDKCSMCDVSPKCSLLKNKTRQDILKKHGIQYVWWADRERASLVPRTRKYLENAFYNCLVKEVNLRNF